MDAAVTDLLVAARSERSGRRSRQLFDLALGACESTADKTPASFVIKAQILTEIAIEEPKAEVRTKRWLEAMRIISDCWKVSRLQEVADMQAVLAVDCFQDSLSDIDFAARLSMLRNARDALDECLKRGSIESKPNLLTRKSSVLRHLSYGDVTPEARIRRLDESVACAKLAAELFRFPAAVLESAQAQWQRARYERTDESYVLRLRSAEEQFTDPILAGDDVAQLALARFYRLTFRQQDACKAFPILNNNIKNLRRLLRESYIYAEACIQLWYADYPEEALELRLKEARGLLETAIAAGYHNARLICDLAYIVAIMDGPEAGTAALSEICGDEQNVSWEEALRLIAESDLNNRLVYTLALGVDQSPVWTTLGTFVRRFLKDDYLTEIFYRTAIRLDRHNAIAQTNLARFLIRTQGLSSAREAQRLLQQAQAFADRRYTWWRAVQAELNQLRSQQKHPPKPRTTKLYSGPLHFVDHKQVRDRYSQVEGLQDPQIRGYELERLVYELARLTFDTAAPPYRIERIGGEISQIDGFFSHRSDKYRVECKWTTENTNHDDVIIFKDKLDVVGVSGLFISMSGFTDSAISRAKEYRNEKAILLMDGEEIRFVFSGQINFDEVIRRKRAHFDQRSEPFYRISPVPTAA